MAKSKVSKKSKASKVAPKGKAKSDTRKIEPKPERKIEVTPPAPKVRKSSSKKNVPPPIITPAIRITIKKQVKPNVSVKAPKSARKPVPEFTPATGLIPAPLTSDSKPRKNQAGLSQKELEFFREILLTKRRELVGDMSSMEREALRSSSGSNLSNLPIHMADMGTDNYEQEFTLGLVEKDRVLLRELNGALGKLQDGSYGLCEGTGKPISKARLEAQPWAKHSIEHARSLERNRHR